MNPQNSTPQPTRMSMDVNPPQQSAPAPTPASETSATPPEQSGAGKVIPLQSGPKKGKGKVVLLALLILALLAAIGGVYYYQQGKLDDISTAKMTADKQVMALETQLKDAATKAAATKTTTPVPAVNYNIVTGNVTAQAVTTASITGLYKPGTVDEIWLEYGTTPDKLTTPTTHITQGLGAGDVNSYATQTFKLTGLTGGQNYFYHVAAKAKGVTAYGGTASFTATK